jgi:hypothetical protein
VLLNPPNFAFSVGGSAGLAQDAAGAAPGSVLLARIFHTTASIPVGNPLTQTAAINLQFRRVDVPPDWLISLTPISVTLAPGQVITATVDVVAGSPVVQGTEPRVAVEGYANGNLIGGVVIDVLVPMQVNFDGKLRVYLPSVTR